jgi:hypothetical protein
MMHARKFAEMKLRVYALIDPYYWKILLGIVSHQHHYRKELSLFK